VTPESLAQVAAPALVIHGRHDCIEDGAHAPFLDDPSVVADVDRFLSGSWPPRAEELRSLVPAPP
jgi:hypothetical protein